MWIKGISTKPSERHFYYTYPIYKNDSSVESLNKEIRKLSKTDENEAETQGHVFLNLNPDFQRDYEAWDNKF